MPSEILSSTAIRALETARLILEQLNLPITALTACEEIYGHGPQGLIVATKKLKPETKIACLVGHNPDVTDFAGMLTGIPINDMPTSGILAVEFDLLHWPKSMEATGRPIHFSGP
jgi:phosphohistidine phosphatase